MMNDEVEDVLNAWVAQRRGDAAAEAARGLWGSMEARLATRRVAPVLARPSAGKGALLVGSGAFAGALRYAIMIYLLFGVC